MEILKPTTFKDRLTTTDESGHRVRVIPMAVRGRFYKYKTKVHFFLVAFFLILPWIKINGLPALQLDVPHRRFFVLGHLFLPQDVPGLFFIVSSFVMALLFFTALYGRIWCGWACPQTVFIEGFFRRVERWVEGNHLEQRALDKAPLDFRKIKLRSAKWFLFLLGSLVVTHSFLAYFMGPDIVLHMMIRNPAENPGSFGVVMVSTAIFLFNFGWFREQFCLIACPYGRFQSVMMDDQSITVTYDKTRSDCIDCLKCVKVCPTGIDIRNGFQMECIACTACIDTCDEVMEKIKKPKGLIRYASESDLVKIPRKLWRARVLVYGGLMLVLFAGLLLRIWTQEIYQTEILRATDTPYQLLKSSDGQADNVINHFKLNWYNLSAYGARVQLRLPESLKSEGFALIQNIDHFDVPSAGDAHHQFFIEFPRRALHAAQRKISLEAVWETKNAEIVDQQEVTIVGPDVSL
jgi:cytochrome c oxidase accessory protein FixG